MIRLFKHYVPHTLLLLGLIDFALLMAAGEAGWVLRLWQLEGEVGHRRRARLPHLITFAIVLQLAMVGVGVYAVDSLQSMRIATARLIVAISLGVLLLSSSSSCCRRSPSGGRTWLLAMGFALLALFTVRLPARPDSRERRVQATAAGARRRAARSADRGAGSQGA